MKPFATTILSLSLMTSPYLVVHAEEGAVSDTGGDESQVLETSSPEEIYRIGSIMVDRRRHIVRATGRIVRIEAPIQYLAVSKGKSARGMIELDSNAIEINFACQLIGLDPRHARNAMEKFDARALAGDPVTLEISWDERGRLVTRPVADLIEIDAHDRNGDNDDGEPTWVYTGSILTGDGLYMADAYGTVIGFAHDPSSIIEHRRGLGFKGHGTIRARLHLLPPVGTKVSLTIRRLGAGQSQPDRDPVDGRPDDRSDGQLDAPAVASPHPHHARQHLHGHPTANQP